MREIIVQIYLAVVKILFTLFKILPLKNKVVFMISFPENPLYIYEQLKAVEHSKEIIFLCEQRTFEQFQSKGLPTYLVDSKSPGQLIKDCYHLATADTIVADNYFGILSATHFKKEVRCLQIWHSVGAIKKFGIVDPNNATRSEKAVARFKTVYERFNAYAVGSAIMGEIFQKAYLANPAHILPFGVPRTDFFFDTTKHEQIKGQFYASHPQYKGKKLLLYAPTFRRYTEEMIPFDIKMLAEKFQDDYVLLLKFHPKLKFDFRSVEHFGDFIYDGSQFKNINELMVVTDLLITDYSSLPMEFIFFKRPMIFYAYDLAQYEQETGLWEDYRSSVPGPVVETTKELVEAIESSSTGKYDAMLNNYAHKWVQYCDGHSAEKIAQWIVEGNCNLKEANI